MDSLVVSAPGKIILHGEHSVVYGKTAVALSLNLRTIVTLTINDSSCVLLSLPGVNESKTWTVKDLGGLQTTIKGDPHHPIALDIKDQEVIQDFLSSDKGNPSVLDRISLAFIFLSKSVYTNLKQCSGLSVEIQSWLPIGAGLGSSASIAVCLAAAFLKLTGALAFDGQPDPALGEELLCLTVSDLDLINKWAFMVEKIFHGSPSGVDNTTCTYGGAVVYRSGQFSPMKVDLKLRILVVNTMVSRNTKEVIGRVKTLKTKYPAIFEPILQAMDQVAIKFETTLRDARETDSDKDHYDIFEDLIDVNQALLSALNVSHPKLQEIVSAASKYGFHAKLTGAGGGGVAFVLLRPGMKNENLELLKEELVRDGFQCWEVTVGGIGVEFKKSAIIG